MGTVTKKDLVECIVAHSGQTRESVRVVLESTLQSFIDVLSRGDRIEIRDFGVFE
ncbi:MAG: HU family DNA-binding protein, partial [bacterium]